MSPEGVATPLLDQFGFGLVAVAMVDAKMLARRSFMVCG